MGTTVPFAVAGFSATPPGDRWQGAQDPEDFVENFYGELYEGLNVFPYPEVNVVYELYDEELRLSYVGSTKNFPQRLRRHCLDKEIAVWVALHCDSRAEAYRLEKFLISENHPYLNKVGR